MFDSLRHGLVIVINQMFALYFWSVEFATAVDSGESVGVLESERN